MLSRLVMFDSLRPHGRSPPGSSVHGDSPGKNTGVGFHALLQGNLPNPGLNAGLLHCRWILYQLRYQENPVSILNAHKTLLWAYYRKEEYGGSRLSPLLLQMLSWDWVHLSVPGGLMFVSMDYLETAVLFQKHQKFIQWTENKMIKYVRVC